MSNALDLRIEWLPAPGVKTPELAATWARYEVWLHGRCVTQVEEAGGTFRRSVFGSLYPLAEWIASNWWSLSSHVRPTAVESRYWTWKNSDKQPWLQYHNFRAAGDGMAWPNLTIVPEGPIMQALWIPDAAPALHSVRFAVGGRTSARTEDMLQGLAEFVDNVIVRLAEAGQPRTRLTEEWDAISSADEEEADFCRTVARLGLDPYAVDDEVAENVIAVSAALARDVAADFFDTADPEALKGAAEWARQAVAAARTASAQASEDLSALFDAVGSLTALLADQEKPWEAGYEMARSVRRELGVSDTDRLDLTPWVGIGQILGESHGVQGVLTVEERRCGVVFGSESSAPPSPVFGRARALGRALMEPDQQTFVLSSARVRNERAAGAFAAELLAPAEGIRTALAAIGRQTDAAFEAVAGHFGVSPLLVRHQYDNQIASAADLVPW